MRLLSLLGKHFPDRRFTRFGDSEPLRKSLRYPEDAAKILDLWGHTIFIGRTGRRDETLHVHFCPTVSKVPRHSAIVLDLLSDDTVEETSLIGFLSEACVTFGADYGMAHMLTNCELDDRLEQLRGIPERPLFTQRPARLSPNVSVQRISTGLTDQPDAQVVHLPGHGRMVMLSGTLPGILAAHQPSGEKMIENLRRRILKEGFATVLWNMFVPGLNTHKLRKGLPDLYWVNVFGPPYAKMFNREKLLNAPAFETRELTSGTVMLRLVPSFRDRIEEWNDFKLQRQMCKQYLGTDAFLDSSANESVRRTPQFEFPAAIYKDNIGAN